MANELVHIAYICITQYKFGIFRYDFFISVSSLTADSTWDVKMEEKVARLLRPSLCSHDFYELKDSHTHLGIVDSEGETWVGDNICNLCNVCNIPYMLYLPCVRLFKRRLSRSHSIYFIAKTNNSFIPIFHCHLNDVKSSPSTYSNDFIIKTSLFETTPSQKEKLW